MLIMSVNFSKFCVRFRRSTFLFGAVVIAILCGIGFTIGLWTMDTQCRNYSCLLQNDLSSGDRMNICSFQVRSNQNFQLESGPEDPSKGHLPDFIGIGVRKCGTGVYMTFLKRHDSFRLPIWKNYETEYFSKRKSCGLQWYQNRFRSSDSDKYFIEKTPHYFYAAPRSIPEDILQVNPRIKIFLLLCDPTPRAYSCYIHHHRWRFNIKRSRTVKQFESYVLEEVPKLQSILSQLNDSQKENYLLEKWNGPLECLLAGLYSVHIKRWMKYFNSSQMLILNGDDLMINPGPGYTEIQDFFGVPRLIRPEDWVKRNSTGHFCLRPPQNRSQLFCQDNGIHKARTRTLTKDAIKPSQDIIDALRQFYKPYNDELFKILNTKFKWT